MSDLSWFYLVKKRILFWLKELSEEFDQNYLIKRCLRLSSKRSIISDSASSNFANGVEEFAEGNEAAVVPIKVVHNLSCFFSGKNSSSFWNNYLILEQNLSRWINLTAINNFLSSALLSKLSLPAWTLKIKRREPIAPMMAPVIFLAKNEKLFRFVKWVRINSFGLLL